MTVFFKRNIDIYISKAPNASADATNTVKLNVKDFSYNQSSSVDKVGRETLDPTEERTLAPHISIVSPVNFSFTTYILPMTDTDSPNYVTSPEEYLWISLMGVDSLTSNSTSSTIDFANGNVATLQNLTLWFDYPSESTGVYRLNNAIVDSATISFNINGIAEVQWSGRALTMSPDGSPPASKDTTTETNYLKNKLSTITLNANSVAYTLALTGGDITIDNNNKFYGRSKIGKTTEPQGHYTGNRNISGNLNFYMKSGGGVSSADLFGDLQNNIANDNYETTWESDFIINISGTTAPYVRLNIPRAILSIPTINYNEVISMKMPFVVKEGTSNYVTVIYNMP